MQEELGFLQGIKAVIDLKEARFCKNHPIPLHSVSSYSQGPDRELKPVDESD